MEKRTEPWMFCDYTWEFFDKTDTMWS